MSCGRCLVPVQEFIEDYNTATLPHAKYYNFDKWEEDEYNREKMKAAKKKKRTRTEFNDEEELHASKRLQQQMKAQQRFEETLRGMDQEKIEEMRLQKQLQNEMQAAYKRGDMEKVRELEKRLAPEE